MRIEDGDGAINGDGVAVIVGGIVGQGAECESVVIEIVRFAGVAEKRADKISAADVMDDVAEFVAAVRVVAEILDDGAAVGVTVGGAEFVVSGVGETRKEQRTDAVFPSGIDNGFVGEDGVSVGARRSKREQEQEDDAGRGGESAGHGMSGENSMREA